MDRIAFIVPTFNRACYIAESLASITSQMGPEDSLTVIDDGSTDDTPAVVKAHSGLTYVRQENAGKSAALNRAMAMTKSKYVWVCDDDDLLLPGAVDTLIGKIEETDADFVFGRYTRFKVENGQKKYLGTGYWPDLRRGSLVRHILEDAFVMQNAALVKREVYERVGPFDETMLRSLDYEMFVRLATRASCAHTEALLFEQRKHDGARGPAKVLHEAGKSDTVWKEFDRRIFERSRDELDLSFYRRMFDCSDPRIVDRAAHLQRACVLARHDLWPLAIEDIEAAAQIDAPAHLAPLERAICRRIVAGKHGFSGACEGDIVERLARTLRSGTTGRAIVVEMFCNLFWRFRQDEPQPMHDAKLLLSKVAGPRYLPLVLWRKLVGRRRSPKVRLTERRELAAE